MAQADTIDRALAPDAPSDLGDRSDATGVMVCFGLSMTAAEQLAVEGGLPAEDHHVTLAYLGDTADEYDPPPDLGPLVQAVAQFSQWAPSVSGSITGGGIFLGAAPEDDVTAVALVDSPDLPSWRANLVAELEFAGIAVHKDHGFIPHISLAEGSMPAMQALPVPERLALRFDHVTVAHGPTVIHLPLLGDRFLERSDAGPLDVAESSLVKAAEERYTLTPLYVPELDDTHGDYVVADDLQRAAWDYVRSGDRDVRLQHLPDTVAGEMVEMVTWPLAVVTDITTGDGTTKRVTLPPGTVYEGVIWEPWAWEMVKRGEINGLSLGGTAFQGASE